MKDLINYLNEINEKSFLISLLYWEMDTITPKKAYDYYVEVSSKIETQIFEMETSDKYIELLDNAINSSEYKKLDEYKQIYFNNLKEDYEKNKRIPKDFYNKYVKNRSKAKQAWTEAKEKKDYNIFKPYLEKNIELTKELYKYMYPDSNNLYDSMINDYERGIKSSEINKLFDELKNKIIPIVKNLKTKSLKKIDMKYSSSELYDLSRFLLNYIGFDNDRGALGIFPHGYTTTISKNDIRIAFGNTRNIFDHMSTIIHEGGHGIFEQYALEKFEDLDMCSIDTLALHESQSRFYENILGRNKNFWIPIYNDIKKMTKIDLELDDFIEYFNNAKPSLIRTEADELTYCLHIIIRYEIENEIFNNNISLDDLPKLWNQKYKDYLGVEVSNDSEGILQDVHWSECSFGYFPSYLLGSIFDGMLLETINEKLGNVDELLKSGKIREITNFLNKNIHKYLGSYNIEETAKRICGRNLDVLPLVRYFEKKYN